MIVTASTTSFLLDSKIVHKHEIHINSSVQSLVHYKEPRV